MLNNTNNRSINQSQSNNDGRNLSNLSLEYARTPAELEKGLMYRLSLCDECGMLFIFESDRQLSFWMKNTYINLDIIFINSDGIVTNIARASAEKDIKADKDYPNYVSKSPAKYALEVNQGWSEQNNLKEGDKIDLNTILR